jgi:hypothetical protein
MRTDPDGLDWDDGSHEGRDIKCMAYYGYCPTTNALDQFWDDWWLNYKPPPLASPTDGGGSGASGGGTGPICPVDGKPPRSCGELDPGPAPWQCFAGWYRSIFKGLSSDCCKWMCRKKVQQEVCDSGDGCPETNEDDCAIDCTKNGDTSFPWYICGPDSKECTGRL